MKLVPPVPARLLSMWPLVLAAAGAIATQQPALEIAGLLAIAIGLTAWAWAMGGRGWVHWLSSLVAVAALAIAFVQHPGEPGSARWTRHTRSEYADIWQRLDAESRRAAQEVADLQPPGQRIDPEDPARLDELFEALAGHAPGTTLLLIRSAGQVVAWAGPALPVDPGGEGGAFAAALPTRGGARAFIRPASVTLTVTRSLEPPWQGWLVSAARGFDSSRLPWQPQAVVRWSVDEGGGAPAGVRVVDGGDWPDLWLDDPGSMTTRLPGAPVGLGLIAVIVVLGTVCGSPVFGRAPRWLAGMLLTSALLAAAGADWRVALGWILGGLVAAGLGHRLGGIARAEAGGRFWSRGVAVGVLLTAVGGVGAVWLTDAAGVTPPGLKPISAGTLLLLALSAAAIWVLDQVPRSDGNEIENPHWRTAVLAMLLTGAAVTMDRPLVAGALVLVLTILVCRPPRRHSTAVTALLLAGLMCGTWSAAERLTLARIAYDSRRQLHALTPGEQQALRSRLEASLHKPEALSLSLGQTALGSVEDLAFGLWRASALNQPSLESVLAVTSEGQVYSIYEAGLQLQDLEATRPGRSPDSSDPEAAESAVDPGHPETIQVGRDTLLFDGEHFADLEFAWRPVAGTHSHAGIRLSPPAVVTAAGRDQPRTSDSAPGWTHNAFSTLSEDGAYRLSLPAMGPLMSLERVAGRAAAAMIVAIALLAVGGAALTPVRMKALIRALRRSYPRRLALTLGALILVPLLVVNLAILTLHERSVRAEQESLERAALESARRGIQAYLDSLPPNFAGITQLNDDLLVAIASIVGRDVDLYWESNLYATSRRERFASGQLGARLPAPVYRELALGGRTQTRLDATSEGGEVAVYAPFERLPGTTGPSLTLAVPVTGQLDLLSQQSADMRSRTLLIGFAVLMVGFAATARAARGFSRPIVEMIAGTERIAAGAGSLGIEIPREQDLGRLAAAIDRMATDVSASQESERIERELLEQILNNVTTGVLLARADGAVTRANPHAEAMLGVGVGARLPGDLPSHLRELAVFQIRPGEGEPGVATVSVEIEGDLRLWQVARLAVDSHGGRAWLWVVEDVTDVVRGERLVAWAEMARIIAHEIKNPLTPIRLSAEHLREVFRRSETGEVSATVERCVSNILEQVDDLRQIADEFSDYSRIPEVRPEWFEVSEWARAVAESYQPDGARGRIEVNLDEAAVGTRIYGDRRLLTRVLRNLLENALRASNGSEVGIEVSASDPERLLLVVSDSGPGVAREDLDRIFEPYFSTHETGTGLGLPISRRIVEAHGGSIHAGRRERGGLRVTVVLPREAETGDLT